MLKAVINTQNTLVNENLLCWHHFFTIFLENYVYYHSLNVWNWYLPPKVIVWTAEVNYEMGRCVWNIKGLCFENTTSS